MASCSTSQDMNTLANKFDAISTNQDGPTIVIFHLDTTLRNQKLDEICQIAARYKEQKFQVYLLPFGEFDPRASEKNGFGIVQNGKYRQLTHNKKVVHTLSPEDGLKEFLKFLSNLTGNTRQVLLAANNCLVFQRHIILRHMIRYGLLDTFKSLVLGFIDTMHVFKEVLPNEDSYELKNLAEKFLYYTIPKTIHSGIYVDLTMSLIETNKCDIVMEGKAHDLEEFIRYFYLKSSFDEVQEGNKRDTTLEGYLWKIAKAGITIDELENCYREDPDNGISNLLTARVKITKNGIMKINHKIHQIIPLKMVHFKNHF